jgi:molybdate transport system substrate-binding protein
MFVKPDGTARAIIKTAGILAGREWGVAFRSSPMRRWYGGLVPALAALALQVASTTAQPVSLTVFAASDLAFAFNEIVPRFERAFGVKVTLVLGSTGNFAHQIEQGAPADVFFAADESFINRLVSRGVLIGETRGLYAQGRLVLATSKSAEPKLTDLRQLLEPRIRRVAIANPVHAPYGRAAREALTRSGLWDVVQPKLVYGENIRQTLQYVQTGAVEVGIIALSVASVPEIEWVPIDSNLHHPLNQTVAVVRQSPRPELGVAFIHFVSGPEGRAIMKRFGFLLPGEF